MAKTVKKSAKNLKRKSSKRQDIILAVVLGVIVTTVGVIVTRMSSASQSDATHSFDRDPVKNMAGGQVKKINGIAARVGEQPAPGVDPVYTPVSKADMVNTLKVCVEYNALKAGTTVNLAYVSGNTGLVTPVTSPAQSSGSGVLCLTTGGVAQDGQINVNVRPGSAQITKLYGIYRAYNN